MKNSMKMTTIVLDKHVDGADCCLIGIILGVTTKKYPPITIPELAGDCVLWRGLIRGTTHHSGACY